MGHQEDKVLIEHLQNTSYKRKYFAITKRPRTSCFILGQKKSEESLSILISIDLSRDAFDFLMAVMHGGQYRLAQTPGNPDFVFHMQQNFCIKRCLLKLQMFRLTSRGRRT